MCDFIFMIYKGRKVLDGTLASIQEIYGMDTVRIQTEGGIHAAEGLAGVEKINDFGQVQELRLISGTDPQSLLQQLLMKTRVTKYEVTAPSLNDIFIRIARPETETGHE
jgi:ABC-2 type transport system ATP-binding protein